MCIIYNNIFMIIYIHDYIYMIIYKYDYIYLYDYICIWLYIYIHMSRPHGWDSGQPRLITREWFQAGFSLIIYRLSEVVFVPPWSRVLWLMVWRAMTSMFASYRIVAWEHWHETHPYPLYMFFYVWLVFTMLSCDFNDPLMDLRIQWSLFFRTIQTTVNTSSIE